MDDEGPVDVALRPMGADDLDAIAPWFWDFEDVALFEGRLPLPVGREALRESWREALAFADPPKALWYVAEAPDGAPMGIAGLQQISWLHGDAVLPMFVGPEARQRGLATALTLRMMEIGFERLRLHRLTTFYRADNDISRHTLAQMGWREEGRQREAWFCGGRHLDLIHVGFLVSEWAPARDALLARHEDLGVRLAAAAARVAPCRPAGREPTARRDAPG